MKKEIVNELKTRFPALSRNEGTARAIAAAFAMQRDPTVKEIAAVKTAVSEAVTNSIDHGYRDREGFVEMTLRLFSDGTLAVHIKDKGAGIENVGEAMRPTFTTAPAEEEHSGLGFTIMESFTDKLRVRSAVGRGTDVYMEIKLKGKLPPDTEDTRDA